MDLNEEQRKAATHPQGEAALLLAGAGAGKTATTTERISWLIGQGVPPRKILGITFTNKAANEIKARVLARTNLSLDLAPRLTTIHSLALSMIRRNPEGFGLGPKISPLDDYDQTELLKKIVAREEAEANPYELLEHIGYHRARGVGFAVDYTKEVHLRASVEYAGYHALGKTECHIWSLFESEKLATNSIDFDDMLHFVNRRCRVDADWKDRLGRVFAHVLMDECQDTSVVSWELVNNLLGPDNRNLFAVGDVNQAIYSFNGSTPQLILDFAKDWRGHPPVTYRLVNNHRSVPEIVNFANALQNNFSESLPLEMVSYRGNQGEKGRITMMRAEMPSDIANKIAQHIAQDMGNLRKYAVLVRTSMQVRDIEGEFVRYRIPYVVKGGRSLLQTEEARDVLSYMRLAINPNDFTALSRCSAAPKRGLGDAALETIRTIARNGHQGDLVKAMRGGKYNAIAAIVEDVQGGLTDPLRAFNTVLNLSGYVAYLRKKYAKDVTKIEAKVENLGRLRLMIEGLAAAGLSTGDMIFQMTMERAADDDERGQVTISTIHSAKGLEWPVVFVNSVVETSIPHWRCQSNSELEEERRLLYVAVTRARDIGVLCIPERIQRGSGWAVAEPSRFLVELGII